MTTATARSRNTRVIAIMAAIALAAAGFAYAWLAPAEPSAAAQLREVTTTVRCPECIGESIADSAAPISAAMRDEAQRRLESGETPAQVREFFAAAYGQDVLLTPPMQGAGTLVWLVPLLLAGAAAVAVVVLAIAGIRHRRGSPMPIARLGAAGVAAACTGALLAASVIGAMGGSAGSSPVADGAAPHGGGAVSALEDAVASSPADVEMRLAYAAALTSQENYELAVEQFAAAHRLTPLDPDVAYLYASALLSAERVEQAGQILDVVLESRPGHAPALLLRGTMLWQIGDARGIELLEEYVRADPDSSQAEAVREVLDGG